VGIERDLSSPLPWRRSQRASQQRRVTQARRRRWAFRGRTGVSCALIAMAFATAGAVAQESPPAGSGGASASGESGSKKASSGASVSAIQRALGLPADGVYGRRTRAAVKRFQRREGLKVDGIAGPATLAALGLTDGDSGDGGADTGDSTGSGDGTGATGDGGSTDSAPRATGTETVSGQAPAASGDAAATLERIAQCESGGNPAAVSAGGQYRGKYQFDQATWEQLGGTGDPAKASETEQDRLAAKLLAQRGTAPWPVCGGG
jgi:hypothetical protein